MSMVTILQMIVGVLTVLFGIATLFRPQVMAQATGLVADTVSGIAELRASWGGTFIGLGLAVLLIPAGASVLGIGYACTALVRIINVLFQRTIVNQTWIIILIFEVVSSVILLLPQGTV